MRPLSAVTWSSRPRPLFLTSKVRLHCDSQPYTSHRSRGSPFPDLKGQAPLRRPAGQLPATPRYPPFPDLKGQAPLRLTAEQRRSAPRRPFPDLKGQAPLRLGTPPQERHAKESLFLTSKVRLHCDRECGNQRNRVCFTGLFLTSKVRLHCDVDSCSLRIPASSPPFPDLKGQAPLRRTRATSAGAAAPAAFS